jgi:tetratricopeptide (TPR) repeat protein
MRYPLLALVVCMLPGASGTAFAQRFIVIPEHGYGDQVVVLGDLPPQARAAVREQIHCEPQVAFLYWHWYAVSDGFDFWTSNGRFVLYDGERYWALPHESLAELLGPEAETMLSTPWRYWIPPGLATVMAVVAVACAAGYLSAVARAKRLRKDWKFDKALEIYIQSLLPDTEPGEDDKRRAFAAGLEFLHRHEIPPTKAEAGLRLLVAQQVRDRSYELRNQAVLHEQAGEWEQAIDYYSHAARLQAEWDQRDHEFLLQCIARVRNKQARSGSA